MHPDATADVSHASHASPASAPRAQLQREQQQQTITKAAQPTKIFFDPYNSSATGHQRAENRLSGSTSWRESRTLKLGAQYQAGHSGGKRLYDTVGAGSENYKTDGRKENGSWEKGASGLRPKGQGTIAEALNAKTVKSKSKSEVDGVKSDLKAADHAAEVSRRPDCLDDAAATIKSPRPRIFANLCIYINGSTAPAISDHKLKRLLAEHGARLSLALGRRTVTHVILGNVCGQGGAGGGLSSSKIQKEIARVGGKGVKYVSVEWVLESVKAGKRLSETRFAPLKIASRGQGSVYTLFKSAVPKPEEKDVTGKG